MGFLFTSEGTKRKIAAVLSLALDVASMFPGTDQIVLAVQYIAGIFGVSGLVHAGASGSLSKHALAGLSAALATLILIARFVPKLEPLIPVLQHLAALLGAAAVGQKISSGK